MPTLAPVEEFASTHEMRNGGTPDRAIALEEAIVKPEIENSPSVE
jgi:hypothetical protein